MLALRGIARAFGRCRAVAGVSLEVAAGEAVLLVGRNGAGKTPLLRIAVGYLDPDAGDVVVDGIAMARQRARAQARLGYLPEHAPAPGELTARAPLSPPPRQERVGGRAAVGPPAGNPRRADQRDGSDPGPAAARSSDRGGARSRGAGVEPRGQ